MIQLSARARFGSNSGKNLGLLMRRANSEYILSPMKIRVFSMLGPRLVGVHACSIGN